MTVELTDEIAILLGAVSVGVRRDPTADLPTPSISKVKSLQASHRRGCKAQTESSTSEEIPARPEKRRKTTTLPETEETEGLSTAELQRLVLLEQLKLIRMQQHQIVTPEADKDN